MTNKCPHCGAPAGKAHVCRHRFKASAPEAKPKKKSQGERIVASLQQAVEIAKGERDPAKVTHVKVRRGKLPPSHPDCARCNTYRAQQRDKMQSRRAKSKQP